jgi:hypothetical protein
MKFRVSSILLVLLLLTVFGLGVFLLMTAEETPAPGLLLMAFSGGALIYRWLGRRAARSSSADDSHFEGLDQARESYDYEAERRRRGDCEMNAHASRD